MSSTGTKALNIVSENQKKEARLTRQQRKNKKVKTRILQAKYKATLVDNPVEETRYQKRKAQEPVVLTRFAKELHLTLKWMWIPLKFSGRLPFSVKTGGDKAAFQTGRCKPSYIIFLVQTILLLIVTIWVFSGFLNVLFGKNYSTDLPCVKIYSLMEKNLVERYILEYMLVLSMLFHGLVGSIFQLLNDHERVQFIRDWYQLVDVAMIRIHFSIKKFILLQYAILLVSIVFILLAYFLPMFEQRWCPPTVFGSCSAIGLAMMKLFVPHTYFHIGEFGQPIYHQWAPLGLFVLLLALINVRSNLLLYMVSCKLLTNAALFYNKRLNIALGNEEVAEGDVALRRHVAMLYHDHIEICSVAGKIGKIFSVSLLAYYALMMLNMVMECFTLGYKTYRLYHEYGFTEKLHGRRKQWNKNWTDWERIALDDDAAHEFVAHVGHLMLSFGSFLYLSSMAIECSDECMRAFEIIRRHGLLKCRTEQDRNFIRSMWISGDTRKRIVISPGNFFSIDRIFVCGFILVVLLFFAHILPLRELLYKNSDDSQYANFSEIIKKGSNISCSVKD